LSRAFWPHCLIKPHYHRSINFQFFFIFNGLSEILNLFRSLLFARQWLNILSAGRVDYIVQSWRKRSSHTIRPRQPVANIMRELNFRSHLLRHYYCLRLLLLDLLSDQKKNDAWKPLLLCSSSFWITRRKPHNAKMRIAYKIFASDICMDTAARDNWSFFLLSVST